MYALYGTQERKVIFLTRDVEMMTRFSLQGLQVKFKSFEGTYAGTESLSQVNTETHVT